MALYVTQAELENAIGEDVFFEIFNDKAAGVAKQAAIDLILLRASSRVDGYLAKEWGGPFPMADPVPPLAKEAAILFATWLSWRRAPEVARRFGRDSKDGFSEYNEAKLLCKELAKNEQRLVGNPEVPAPANVSSGGVYQGNGFAADGIGLGTWKRGLGGY